MQHRSQLEIQEWLIRSLGEQLRIDPQQIDPAAPFVRFGADSLTMVTIGGDLEVWLDRSLSPNLLWEYPTIESLSNYLAGGEGRPSGVVTTTTELERELDQMSDDELRELLAE